MTDNGTGWYNEPDLAAFVEVANRLAWTAQVVLGVAGGLILLQGWQAGWSTRRIFAYGICVALSLLFTQFDRLSATQVQRILQNPWAFLVGFGAVGFVLQLLSGNPMLQPIVFTVPIVYATLWYPIRLIVLFGVYYLALMVVGLWWSGTRSVSDLALPVIGYGLLMITLTVFTSQLVRQTRAWRYAEQLASDLAHERDYLERLAHLTAQLPRDLSAAAALERMAHGAQALIGASQAYVWLAEQQSLQLVYPPRVQPESAAIAAVLSLPEEGQVVADTLWLPWDLQSGERVIVELQASPVAPFTNDDLQRLQPFVSAAAVAYDNARLFAQASQIAVMSERNRLARELHDTIAQELTAVTMQLEAAQRGFDRDLERTRGRVGRAHELARDALVNIRRSVWMLAESQVEPSAFVSTLTTQMRDFELRTGVAARYHHEGPLPPIDSPIATQLSRIVQEALQNVEKHAQAQHVSLSSRVTADTLWLELCDDGVGFAVAELRPAGVERGFGLRSLHERAHLIGGTLELRSTPGQGTQVQVIVPLVAET